MLAASALLALVAVLGLTAVGILGWRALRALATFRRSALSGLAETEARLRTLEPRLVHASARTAELMRAEKRLRRSLADVDLLRRAASDSLTAVAIARRFLSLV